MLWLVILVCFSILDTAILVPWMLAKKRSRRKKEEKRENSPDTPD